ncbi:DUF5677 domain-containing protein [Mucilaginibacter sp. UYCu711]|uniref:DUF5677 domain-containing protein n=1 Tax=Mucilaginibacter sp. UYCu711 TaxID=3156339 RepID=UPI003D1AB57B
MMATEEDLQHEQDFDELILAFITIGNKLQGTENVLQTKNLMYAEGLGRKILQHTLSVKYLAGGFALTAKGNSYEPQVDFSSVCILSRAALETYLTFNHVYVQPDNPAEHQFRFDSWDYAGYVERQRFSTRTPETLAKQQQEAVLSQVLKTEIEQSPVYQTLNRAEQRELSKGNWRGQQSWSSLAINAGFSKSFFDDQYKFLCGHAHSSRLSVIQIQQVTDLKGQKEMAMASAATLMCVLAKYMYDYIRLIPELNALVDKKSREYYLLDVWRRVGNKL